MFVADLRARLEERGHAVWVDSRQLRGGAELAPEIEMAIASASQVIVVLSPATVNSPWVAYEVRPALRVQARVIPMLLPGMTVGALGHWFPDEEPLAVAVGADGLAASMPELLAALRERDSTDREEFTSPRATAVEELVLRFSEPRIVSRDGVRQARATARLVHESAQVGRRAVEAVPFGFTAPLGPI